MALFPRQEQVRQVRARIGVGGGFQRFPQQCAKGGFRLDRRKDRVRRHCGKGGCRLAARLLARGFVARRTARRGSQEFPLRRAGLRSGKRAALVRRAHAQALARRRGSEGGRGRPQGKEGAFVLRRRRRPRGDGVGGRARHSGREAWHQGGRHSSRREDGRFGRESEARSRRRYFVRPQLARSVRRREVHRIRQHRRSHAVAERRRRDQ